MKRLAVLVMLGIVGVAGCGGKAAVPKVPAPKISCPFSVYGPMPQHAARAKWTHAPAMKIVRSHSYQACIKTTAGNIVVDLMPKSATAAVNAMVVLANHHFYDGARF